MPLSLTFLSSIKSRVYLQNWGQTPKAHLDFREATLRLSL